LVNVNFSQVWVNDPVVAQRAFNGMATVAEASNRLDLLSVVDVFQGMAGSYSLPIVKPTIGMIHSATLFIVADREVKYNIARKITEDALLRKGQRDTLLTKFKAVFPDAGAADRILSMCEQLSHAVFKSVAHKNDASQIYLNALMKVVKPSLTQIAASEFRTQTVQIDAVQANRRSGVIAQPARKVVSVYQPAVKVSNTLQQFLTGEEKVLHTAVSEQVVRLGQASSIAICEHPDINVRVLKVAEYVKSAYSIQKTIDTLIKERRETVRARCFEKAKQHAIVNNLPLKDGKLDLKYWDMHLWNTECEMHARENGLDPAKGASLMVALKALFMKPSEYIIDPGVDVPRFISHYVSLITAVVVTDH